MAAVFTNLRVYLAIAEEALTESKRLLEAGRRPKPDGQSGYIISHDPQQKSFKQSLIAIAFAGMYLEALLSLLGRERWGRDFYDKEIDHQFRYEGKLRLLGIVDQSDLESCIRFRESRNDLIHEKALEFEEPKPTKQQKKQKNKGPKLRVAQEEADFGVQFVKSMASKLQPAP